MAEAEKETELQNLKSRNLELQEQLLIYKEDLVKKDEHIKALSSMEIKRSPSQASESIETKVELATLEIKLENVNKKLEEKDDELKDQAEELMRLKCEITKLTDYQEQLRQELEFTRVEKSSLNEQLEENSVSNQRSQIAIERLQQQLNEATDELVKVKSELNDKLDETGSHNEKFGEFVAQVKQFKEEISKFIGVSSDSESEIIYDKIKTIIDENNSLKGEIANLREEMDRREEKYLESRESLRKLTKSFEDVESETLENLIRKRKELTLDLNKANLDKSQLETDKKLLEDKVVELTKKLEECRQQLEEQEGEVCKIKLEKRETSYTTRNITREFESFKENIAGLLGNGLCHVDAVEDTLRNRIAKLVSDNKEKDHTIFKMEERLRNMSVQYEKNYECAKDCDLKARRTELEYLDLKDHIKKLEKELTKRDICSDELRADKERLYHFIRRIAALLKMDPYTREHNLTLVFDGILDRVDQLVSHESQLNIDTDGTIIKLKRRVNDLKDQLHSRDLHLEMIRKKLHQQQHEVQMTNEQINDNYQRMETDDTMKTKLNKQQKLIERLRDENRALKSEIFDLADSKTKYDTQQQEIDSLKHNLSKLERVRQRQAEKIGELSKFVDNVEGNAEFTRDSSEQAIQSLANELRAAKSALERAKRSEKEMLDFRCVVGKILGLKVDDLAIPNYDIIRRLEKLVSMPKGTVSVAVPLQQQFGRPGYEDANRILGRRRISPRRPIHSNTRPRSISPIHEPSNGYDPRQY